MRADAVARRVYNPASPMSLTPGATLGPYTIRAQLGAGGMGVVYTAHDPRLDRQVAIKVLAPDLTRDDTANQRFLQEAQAASALDHPNICTVHILRIAGIENADLENDWSVQEHPLTSVPEHSKNVRVIIANSDSGSVAQCD